VFIALKFADGSNGAIAYLAEGDRVLAKERVEIFGEGKSLVLDDYRTVTMYRNGREKQVSLKAQDKGQKDQVTAVCAAVLSGKAPIGLDDLASTSRATFRILDSLRERARIDL
jgi:polar amino acid transport system substrate-binding protein